MNWKFWHRHSPGGTGDIRPGAPKLAKPKDIPQSVGRYLVVDQNQDPDVVWGFKAVSRPVNGQEKMFGIRIFNPAATRSQGVTVENYDTLDQHPDLVILAGTYNKSTDTFIPLKPETE